MTRKPQKELLDGSKITLSQSKERSFYKTYFFLFSDKIVNLDVQMTHHEIER